MFRDRIDAGQQLAEALQDLRDRTDPLVVRLEDHPLRAAVQALLDEQSQPPHRNVFVVVIRQCVGAAQGAGDLVDGDTDVD